MSSSFDKDKVMFSGDLPLFNKLLSEMTSKTKEVREHVKKLKDHIHKEECDPSHGISLLELKFQLLMSYLVNLVQVIRFKTNGQSISHSPPIHRLVEIRTVLERIRPLDNKLKYQVDKLIRTASTGMASASDPLRFKPNPSNLLSKLDKQENGSDDSESTSQGPKLYVPPKVHSVPFNDRPLRGKQKGNSRMTGLMEELKEEVLDMPSEIKTSAISGGSKKQRELAEQRDLERFEEDNMMRTMRKRKSHDTGRSNRQEIDDLTDFSEFRSLTQNLDGDIRSPGKKVKRKVVSKKKKKKGYRKK